ncbi:YceD family protein [Methylophilaceae bacterium]|nr:YceD family protein [Methylophilaceae bacterium]
MKNNYNLQNFDLYRFIAKKEKICDKISVFKFNRISEFKFSDNASLFYDVSVSEDLGQYFFNLNINIDLRLLCCRCLEDVEFRVKTSNRYELVQAIGKSEKHVIDDIKIEIIDNFDLLSFIEDEILLELPTSPKHAFKCN